MTEPDNAARAEWARQSVLFFGSLTRMTTAGETLHTMAGDLLANLNHLAHAEGWNLDEMLDAAAVLADEERSEERSEESQP